MWLKDCEWSTWSLYHQSYTFCIDLHHSHDYTSPQHDFLMGLRSVLGICICLTHAHVGVQECVIIYSACVVGAVSMMT